MKRRTLRTTALAALAAALFSGCAAFGGGGPTRAPVSDAATAGAQKEINAFAHALRLKLWSGVAPLLSQEDASVSRDIQTRAEALWAKGQIVDLQVEVQKVTKTADFYDARVKWSLSLLGKEGMQSDDGKCDVYLRRNENGFLIFRIEGNAFL